MQNNRFYNVLIDRLLFNKYACEKYLQFYSLLFVYKVGCSHCVLLVCKNLK